MDEVLFRGQKFDMKEWVYGFYYSDIPRHGLTGEIIGTKLCHFIQPKEPDSIFRAYRVTTESVGQFTGLFNKDKSKLFSGKIRIDISGIGGGEAEIKMYEGKWQIFESSQGYLPLFNALERDNFTITQEY